MKAIDPGRRKWLALGGHGMALLSLGALAPLAACGGGGEGDDGGGGANVGGTGEFGGDGAAAAGTPGAPVSTAVRQATLAAAQAAIAGHASGGAGFDALQVARSLQALPGLARVGISSRAGNVWARFTDGRALVLPNNLEPAAAAAAAAARDGPAAQSTRTPAQAFDLPQRDTATAAGDSDIPAVLCAPQFRLLDMLGEVPIASGPDAAHFCRDFVDGNTLADLRTMAVGRGFELAPIQRSDPVDIGIDNGVPGLGAVGGDGVLLITASAAQVGNDDAPRSVICTATIASDTNLASYEAELAAGLLVYAVTMRGVGGNWQPFACLAITPEFVRARAWRFPTECIGIFNLSGGVAFGDWIAALNAAGLGTILGWEQPVSWQRMLAFADDLVQFALGTNNLDGTQRRQKAEPRLRPFGVGETLGHLTQRGITGGAAYYLPERTPSRFVNALVPALEHVILRESTQEVELIGQFGRRADTAAGLPRVLTSPARGNPFPQRLLSRASDGPLGGSATLRDPSWTGNVLTSPLNEEDLARGGWLQVFNGGRLSNVVPITHWEIPVQAVTTIDALTLTVTVSLRLRADVHPWRLEPDGEARAGNASVMLDAMLHSRADFVASGTITRDDAETRSRTTISWSGSGTLAKTLEPQAIQFSGLLDWATRRLSMVQLILQGSVQGSAEYQQRTVVERFDINGELLSRSDTTINLPVSVTAFGQGAQPFEMQFDDQWGLQAGQFEMPPENSDLLPAPPQLQRRLRLGWTAVVADVPPSDTYGGT